MNGVDINGADSDGFININFARPFQLDPNAPVDFGNGQLDFYSVIDHELTHALGFVSAGKLTDGGIQSEFDRFLTTNAGVTLVDPASGAVNQAALTDAVANSALFNGANAVAKFGRAVPIQGSGGDLSHLETTTFSSGPGGSVSQNALMLCCGGANVQFEPRDYDAAEIGILSDLGYTENVSAVPEPASYALVLTGLGAVAFTRRRRTDKT